jgi:hypothetical protein
MALARLALASAGLLSAACLPQDKRPPPSRVDVTVTAAPSASAAQAFVTADGWTVSFDRVLTGVRASLGGGSCAEYYNDGYIRVLDLSVAGPQHLVTLYSLGHCDFGFRTQAPNNDPYTPLGARVTEADRIFINEPECQKHPELCIDPYTKDRNGNPIPTGRAFYVKGHAAKGAITKTFEWTFRQRALYQECAAPHVGNDAGTSRDAAVSSGTRDAALDASRTADGSAVDAGASDASLPLFTDAGSPGPKGLDLASGGARSVDIRMNARVVLYDTTNLTVGSPRFDVIALADDHYGNGDGNVTLDELRLVPLSDVSGGGRYEQPHPEAARVLWTTLEDFVYVGLYPSVGRFEGTGTCTTGLQVPRAD